MVEAENVMFVEHWPGAAAAVMLPGQVIVGKGLTVTVTDETAPVQP